MSRNWKEILLGKKSAPRPTTTRPEQPTNWEIISGQRRRTGRSLSELLAVLGGRQRAAVLVCQEGHPVPEGSTTCPYGHYVG